MDLKFDPSLKEKFAYATAEIEDGRFETFMLEKSVTESTYLNLSSMLNDAIKQYEELLVLKDIAKRDPISEDLMYYLKPALEGIGYEFNIDMCSIDTDKIKGFLKTAGKAIWKFLRELIEAVMDHIKIFLNTGNAANKDNMQMVKEYETIIKNARTIKTESGKVKKNINVLQEQEEKFFNSTLAVKGPFMSRQQVVYYNTLAIAYFTVIKELYRTLSPLGPEELDVIQNALNSVLSPDGTNAIKLTVGQTVFTILGESKKDVTERYTNRNAVIPKEMGYESFEDLRELVVNLVNEYSKLVKTSLTLQRVSKQMCKQLDKFAKAETKNDNEDLTQKIAESFGLINQTTDNVLYIGQIGALSIRFLLKSLLKYMK